MPPRIGAVCGEHQSQRQAYPKPIPGAPVSVDVTPARLSAGDGHLVQRAPALRAAAGRCTIRRASVPVQIVEMASSPGDEGVGYAHRVGGDVFLVRPDGCVASRCFGERRAEHPGAPVCEVARCAEGLGTHRPCDPRYCPPLEQSSDNSRHGRSARRDGALLFVIAAARHIVRDALFI